MNGRFTIIDTISDTVVYEGNAQAVAQNVRQNNYFAVLWVLGLFTFAVLTTTFRTRFLKVDTNMGTGKVLLFAVGGFLVGSSLGELAGQISGESLMDWGTPCYIREWAPEDIGLPAFLPFDIIIPYVPIFFWPLVHGAVVMVGPLIAIGWVNNKLSDYVHKFLEEPQAQISIIAPAAQAGSATWMFYPLIEGMGVPGPGLWVALTLSMTAIAISSMMAVPMSKALSGDFGTNQKDTVTGLSASIIGLLLLLPIGLYDEHYFIAALIGAIACIITFIKCKEMVLSADDALSSDDIDIDVTASNLGSLDKPAWLDIDGLNLAELVAQAEKRSDCAHQWHDKIWGHANPEHPP